MHASLHSEMKMIQALTVYVIAVLILTSDGQSCFDTVNVRQRGTNSAQTKRQVIVPEIDFSCNGRITGYLISLEKASSSGNYPIIQVWHPTSSTVYTRVDTECPLTENDISRMGNGDEYYLGNISCTGNSRIEFQSGDVIGHYHANEVIYRLWNIEPMGYTAYHRDEGSPLNTFDINNVDDSVTRQPLIQVLYDIRCDNLSTLTNGMMSCSSGREGVGYEGDNCSFTCNTGYELTGSDTRTCQSNGNWSGTEVACLRAVSSTSASMSTSAISDTVISSVISTIAMSDMPTTTMYTTDISTAVTLAMSTTVTSAMSTTMTLAMSTTVTSAMSTTMTLAMSTTVTSAMSITMASAMSTTVTSAMSTTVTSAMSTTMASAMSTTVTSTISTVILTTTVASVSTTVATTGKPSNVTQTDSEDSSSSIGGIVAGCVVGICVIVVAIFLLLVLYLVWYQRRRRKQKDTQGYIVNYESADGSDYHQYSVVRDEVKNRPGLITMIKDDIAANYEATENSVYYSSADKIIRDSNGKPNEAMPYMDPISTIYKNHHKVSSDDYEALPSIHDYEMSDIADHYEVATPSTLRDSIEHSAMEEVLPDNEQIYEDPGHKKEKIYEWFEKKKFRKFESDDVKILQELGSGEFGTVHLGQWSNGSTDPVQVAVKTLNTQCSESDRVKFLREAAIMGQFVHNNVVQLHGVVTEEENMMIVLEYMPKGDLRDFLINLKTTTPPDAYNSLESDLLSFCRQIAAGMNYLASKQFVHRDLAARNILVSSDDVCKIADFGMARDVADDIYYITTGGKIPLKWTAPEAIFYKKYSVQSDVWSFGCVMYEVWSLGHKPFDDLDGKEYILKITTGYRLPPPPGCPRAIYELMIECWHSTTKSRPTSGSISQTLQKSDRALLTSSVQVTDDDVTSESQSMMLGAPLTAGSQLYLDLQQRYTNRSS